MKTDPMEQFGEFVAEACRWVQRYDVRGRLGSMQMADFEDLFNRTVAFPAGFLKIGAPEVRQKILDARLFELKKWLDWQIPGGPSESAAEVCDDDDGDLEPFIHLNRYLNEKLEWLKTHCKERGLPHDLADEAWGELQRRLNVSSAFYSISLDMRRKVLAAKFLGFKKWLETEIREVEDERN